MRFLLDTGRCLCTLNESPEEFPSWLSPAVHHLIYDCLKCQLPCPMNRDFIHNVAGPIKFTESWDGPNSKRCAFSKLAAGTIQKVDYLGFSWWWEAIPRNLKMMFELEDSGQNKQVDSNFPIKNAGIWIKRGWALRTWAAPISAKYRQGPDKRPENRRCCSL